MVEWYAVQAKRHNETRVIRNLSQQVIPTFLPLVEVVRHRRGRRLALLEPLFPGYLFVRLEPMEVNPGLWHAVRWTPGVRSILGTEGAPVAVPDGVVEAINDRVRDLGFVRPGAPFAPNARVLVRRGPLAGLEAVFDRPLSPAGRVRVLMQLLGRQRPVEVDALDLELA